jgi:hypothetical protein
VKKGSLKKATTVLTLMSAVLEIINVTSGQNVLTQMALTYAIVLTASARKMENVLTLMNAKMEAICATNLPPV